MSWDAPIRLTPDRIDLEIEGHDHLTETGFKDVKTNLRTTKYLDTLQDYNTYYYWRVIATNQHGDSSPSVPTCCPCVTVEPTLRLGSSAM